MTIQCGNYRQFCRMRDWAVFLGLDWDYGTGLGELILF